VTYKPLRKDLTETTRKCDFCPNYLTSLKAYILEEEGSGRIVYAGPKCAEKKINKNYTLAGLPDLTKFTLPNGVREGGFGGVGGSAGSNNVDPTRLALEYLALREEKLVGVMQTSYSVLRQYYIKSRLELLTDSEVRHINNIEAKSPEKLRLTHLQRCYNYLFWIDIAIDKLCVGKTGFLKGIRQTLLDGGNISEGQKVAVNKWLNNIDGVPQLK
jgi:hypothetical protein